MTCRIGTTYLGASLLFEQEWNSSNSILTLRRRLIELLAGHEEKSFKSESYSHYLSQLTLAPHGGLE